VTGGATRRTTGAAAATQVEPPRDGDPWTVMRLMRWSGEYLEGKGVEGGRLDAEHLLSSVLGMGRLDLYLHFDRPVAADELARFKPLLQARAGRKPLQYVLGRAAFREIELVVDPRVLIPRPETEELVGAVLAQVRESGRSDLRILDVGTGSGAIALALAHEETFAQVVATDLSEEALVLARENAGRLGLTDRVEFRCGPLLEPVMAGEQFDVIVSNPPYVSEEDFEGLDPEVRDWEPRMALVAKDSGLAVALALVDRSRGALSRSGLLALEVGVNQAGRVAEAIEATTGFEKASILKDLAGRERMVLARWSGA
jgi:release factor glutamine methyltransferase